VETERTRVGCGVYARGAMFNHSCVPNLLARFDGATLRLLATGPIAAGDGCACARAVDSRPPMHC
jgi:hypothetical protein